MNDIGSFWNKWDLHFHTPSSYDYEDKSVTNEVIVDSLLSQGVRVIGITDHHLIDVKRIKELQNIAADRLTVLPGIEFLADLRGKDPIHFIGLFSESCDLQFIWEQIKNRTSISKIYGEGKKENEVYCDLVETFTIIKELGGIITIHAGSKSNTVENLTHSLPHGAAQKTDIAHNVNVYELGKEADQEGYITGVFPVIRKILPMIICSDNHNVLNYSVKQNLWIKAEPTFEGLKQIIYEPTTRVKIAKNRPSTPLRRIDKVNFTFEEGTRIVHQDDDERSSTLFCFGKNYEIKFSPYFTCIVGGRGSGKSTILSLIAEKVGIPTTFFKVNTLVEADDTEIEISDKVELEGTTEIEYISQNQVEKYANSEELTDAVYDRIKNLHFDEILAYEQLTTTLLETVSRQIDYLLHEKTVSDRLIEIDRQLVEFKKIVDHYSSQTYKSLTDRIKKLSDQKQSILISKGRYQELRQKLIDLENQYEIEENAKNEYEVEIGRILQALNELTSEKSFVSSDTSIISLDKQISENKSALDEYMKSQGVSEEDVDEYERALERIPVLNAEKQVAQQNLEETRKKIVDSSLRIEEISSNKNNFENYIEEALTPLNDQLKNIDVNVADIKFEYRFNASKAKEKVHNDFELQFNQFRPSEYGTRRNAVKDYLFCISPWEVDDYDEYLQALERHGSNANAKGFIRMIFEEKTNFEIYKLIIKSRNNNILEHKSIIGFYDNKEFRKCSFGQRCTAVIVALLMFGNKPIIIDEPEAHLDSKLIAEYLINLIKERKKMRQIIFATHNANFVINGDAELIHCLEIDSSNLSNIYPTTIENLSFRDRLLALEGGEEAFLLRDRKLLKEI
ncbi:TrlF family AAA-like ATPase [Phaeodactylibacter xiamenensis]|uniref:TrlF family AAA-like ATPase n=1 Tax=Phaeodactylibacter xiamenensis TaxID=1524460 RepID=UPI003BAADEEB